MTPQDQEFDSLLRDFRNLTPGQRDRLLRRVIGRARAYRAQAIRALFGQLFGWIRRRTAIKELQRLDDRMLKDIGISRGEIETVVRGPATPRRAAVARSWEIPARRNRQHAGRAA